MTIKQKSGVKSVVWRRVRHFEYMLPMPLDETIRLLRTPTDYFMDPWLVAAKIVIEMESPEIARMAFSFGKQILFDGYLKALPDGTTLVSGKVIAHLSEPETLSLEEDMESKGRVFALLVTGAVIVICGVFTKGVDFLLQACLGTVGIVSCLIVVFVIVTTYQWYRALQRRDDLLMALQNRFGVLQDVSK